MSDCRHNQTRVKQSRRVGTTIYRERQCVDCKHTYMTAESVVAAAPEGTFRQHEPVVKPFRWPA